VDDSKIVLIFIAVLAMMIFSFGVGHSWGTSESNDAVWRACESAGYDGAIRSDGVMFCYQGDGVDREMFSLGLLIKEAE
jgi:hypothetical protein